VDPNSLNTVAMIVYPALIVAILVLGRRASQRKRIVITDFRRGVHFIGGVFAGVLDAGSYSFNPRKEQITIVDMRPQPVLIERLGFQDALSRQGVISIGTDLLVRDPQLASTALRDQVKDAYILARDAVRTAMSKQILPDAGDGADLPQTLAAAMRAELGKVGMDISDIEITELWSGPPSTRLQAESVSTVVQ
jgi:hypothetical protein